MRAAGGAPKQFSLVSDLPSFLLQNLGPRGVVRFVGGGRACVWAEAAQLGSPTGSRALPTLESDELAFFGDTVVGRIAERVAVDHQVERDDNLAA